MNSNRHCEAAITRLDVCVAGNGTIELIAVVTGMVGVACIAGALLLTTPATLDAVASTTPLDDTVLRDAAGRPFHERYPISASAETLDAPTF